MTICIIGGYTYFITFTNDYPRYGYVYLMKHKSELFERFKEFRNEVEKQTEKSIKILQLDQGGEYLSCISRLSKNNRLLSQWTPLRTQLNGLSESKNCMLQSMISYANIPLSF
jgi:hypothetical protein